MAFGREIAGSPLAPALLRWEDPLRASANRERELRDLIATSLAEDRRDWRELNAVFRPLVVVRGALVRTVLRLRVHRELSVRRALQRELGAAALDACSELSVASAHRARALRTLATAAEERIRTTRARAPGILLKSTGRAVRESTHFGRVLLKEMRAQAIPRLPGLAGLGVGWWIANTFTDSGLEATLHSWGIGDGPRNVVSSETLRAMNFWLPLLAAAACSYAASRLAAWVRARYAPEAAPDASTAHASTNHSTAGQ